MKNIKFKILAAGEWSNVKESTKCGYCAACMKCLKGIDAK